MSLSSVYSSLIVVVMSLFSFTLEVVCFFFSCGIVLSILYSCDSIVYSCDSIVYILNILGGSVSVLYICRSIVSILYICNTNVSLSAALLYSSSLFLYWTVWGKACELCELSLVFTLFQSSPTQGSDLICLSCKLYDHNSQPSSTL